MNVDQRDLLLYAAAPLIDIKIQRLGWRYSHG